MTDGGEETIEQRFLSFENLRPGVFRGEPRAAIDLGNFHLPA